ncbi:TRO [Symbiodinium microadriaticum]|nr:TRO [Symbiodinium microadriaticum]
MFMTLVMFQFPPVRSQANWCEGNPRYWPPLAHLCPVSCSCAASETPADYCPSSCRACGDAAVFPANGPVTNCAEAKAAGICGVPADAAEYCSGTCGLCNATNVSLPTAPCVDGVLPPSLGLHNCSYLQARGWCRPLTLMNSPLSNLCGQSCGTCS